MKNGYSNYDDRVSYSVEIVKCNPEVDKDCKNDALAEKLLSQIFFTLYNIEELVDFKNPEKLKGRPIRTQDSFHSQFQLKVDRYRDNNNFLRLNKVEASDDRINVYGSPNHFQFFDIQINPTWESGNYISTNKVSFDGK